MEVEGGKVKSLHVEPDNTGLDGKILIVCEREIANVSQFQLLRRCWVDQAFCVLKQELGKKMSMEFFTLCFNICMRK